MSNRQDRPLAKKLLHALGLLALALFLLYVAVQFVLIFHRSYKTCLLYTSPSPRD